MTRWPVLLVFNVIFNKMSVITYDMIPDGRFIGV